MSCSIYQNEDGVIVIDNNMALTDNIVLTEMFKFIFCIVLFFGGLAIGINVNIFAGLAMMLITFFMY